MTAINPVEGSNKVKQLLSKLTFEEKIQLAHGCLYDPYNANQAGFIKGVERLGIPDVFITDGEMGINTVWEATALPVKSGLAATFDIKSSELHGEVIGREAKAMGMHVVLTPRVNIARDFMTGEESNGGLFQTYGEDPFLNGVMGASEAAGVQKDNNAIANLKQMFGSSSGAAAGANNSIIDEQTMHEIYMRAFGYVARSGVGSAMTNYNHVNGIWTTMYTTMNKTLLRDKWGFQGFLINDWMCLYDTESIIDNVGIEMPGNDFFDQGHERSVFGKRLMDAIGDPDNLVNIDHLDRQVGYFLLMLIKFDMLGHQRIPGPLDEKTKLESAGAARTLAQRAAVLLKNQDDILPVNLEKEKIAVIGANARQVAMPTFKESAFGFSDRMIPPLNALRSRTENEILFSVGVDLEGELIPAENLRCENDSSKQGVERYIYRPSFRRDNSLNEFAVDEDTEPIIDRHISFEGDNALPPLPSNGSLGANPLYLWKGKIIAAETGFHRISVQSSVPGPDVHARNGITNKDCAIFSTGSLFMRPGGTKGEYQPIGMGNRIWLNGGAIANSSVVPTLDGLNNMSGMIYMEAGKEYSFACTLYCIYNEPLQARLNWVTPSMAEKNICLAADAAKSADKAVVFVWRTGGSFELADHQNKLVSEVAKANPNTIIVINSGDPVAMPWIDEVKGVLNMWFSGQEGGHATADILTGAYNPGGKLPITFPRKLEDTAVHAPGHPERQNYSHRSNAVAEDRSDAAIFTEGINMGYRWYDANNIRPLFEFGFGLSYTSFDYSHLKVTKNNSTGGLSVSFKLKNTGDRSGSEAPQCYICRPVTVPAGVQASPKALCAFTRVDIEPGEEKTILLEVDAESLSYYRVIEDNDTIEPGEGWTLLKGSRELQIGSSSRDVRLRTVVEI